MVIFKASSIKGKCIKETGSSHLSLHFLHNSLANVSLFFGYLLSFIVLLSLLMEIVKAYQKQLLSSLIIFITDDLFRMLSLFLLSLPPEPWGWRTKWNLRMDFFKSIASPLWRTLSIFSLKALSQTGVWLLWKSPE